MARNSARNSNLSLAAAAFGVVVFGAAVGYFVVWRPAASGGSSARPMPAVSVAQTPSAPVAPPAAVRPRDQNSDYSAPGAPRISIVEEKTPTLTDKSSKTPSNAAPASDAATPIVTPDVEPPPAAPRPSTSHSETPTKTAEPAEPSPDAPPTVSASPVAPTSDTDYEKPATDPEAAQEGTSNAGSAAGRPMFRVQSASFGRRENAQRLADALKERGFTTSTRAERDGDKTVYKVQVGAFRTRAAANKAASDLQNSGYPAYVSTVGP